MFSVEGNIINVTKGDTGVINLALDNYKLQEGDKVTLTVKQNINDSVYVLQKIVTEFEEGTAKIMLSSSDTNIEPIKYVYDIQVDLADGRVQTVVIPSIFKVLKGVTD